MRICVDPELTPENVHLVGRVTVLQSGEDVTRQCTMADEQGAVTRRHVFDRAGKRVLNAERTRALRKWVYGPVKIIVEPSVLPAPDKRGP